MSETCDVVIGSGVLGRTVARLLRQQGRHATLLSRSGATVQGETTVACDVTVPGSLERHLGESSRIFFCAAPAYTRWKQEFPLLVDGLRRTVRGRTADIVYGDNLYAYGARDRPLTESMPYAATTVKGRARADAAVRLMEIHGSAGVRVAIVRAADFYGPGVERSVVGLRVMRDVIAGRPAHLIGDPDAPHALTHVADHARCMIAVGSHARSFGECWHTPNAEAMPLREVLRQVATAGGMPLRLRSAGPLMLRALGVFDPALRELVEMLYMFDRPFLVNHDKVTRSFGLAPTPLADGLADTVRWVRLQA